MDWSIEMEIIEKLKKQFNLQTLPKEGGFYCETYRSSKEIPNSVSSGEYDGARSLSTAIFYLLTPDTHSALHKLPGDEVYHFYLGDPVELLQLYPDGSGKITLLGQEIFNGMQLQLVVPGDTYQGARLADGGSYALMGMTMAPGFAFEDFTPGDYEELVGKHPKYKEIIADLT